jgi:hypothetical protein
VSIHEFLPGAPEASNRFPLTDHTEDARPPWAPTLPLQ